MKIEMTQKYERGTESNINPFTMVLKGVIEADVNGGVARYQDAFFVPEYIEQNPDHADRVNKLKQCLNDQVFFSLLLFIFLCLRLCRYLYWGKD